MLSSPAVRHLVYPIAAACLLAAPTAHAAAPFDADGAFLHVATLPIGLTARPLPLGDPVTVQLVNSANGLCWGASYTGEQLLTNEVGQLEARAR